MTGRCSILGALLLVMVLVLTLAAMPQGPKSGPRAIGTTSEIYIPQPCSDCWSRHSDFFCWLFYACPPRGGEGGGFGGGGGGGFSTAPPVAGPQVAPAPKPTRTAAPERTPPARQPGKR